MIATHSILIQWGGRVLSGDKHTSRNKSTYCTFNGRRSGLHAGGSQRETLRPLPLPFRLVVLATKTQPSVLSWARNSSQPWLHLTLPSSPFQPIAGSAPAASGQLQIFLLTHLQAPTCVYSFPSRRLKPHHRPPGFSAVYLFHQRKQGFPNLPSHYWRKSSFRLNLQARRSAASAGNRLPSSAPAVGSVVLVSYPSLSAHLHGYRSPSSYNLPTPWTALPSLSLRCLRPSQNQPSLSDNEQRISSWQVGDGISIVNAMNIITSFCVRIVLVVA